MVKCFRTSKMAFIFALLFFALFSGVLHAAASSTSATGTASSVIVPSAYTLTNNSAASGTVSNITLSVTPALVFSTALQEALKQGPMVYAATSSSVLVIDSSTRNVVSTIKPGETNSYVNGVAVSPDGQFVYMAYSWSKYHDDPYGGYTDTFGRVLRLNASTQQPIDYYEVDGKYLEHLVVSPDGRVYLGVQQAGYPDHASIEIMDFQQQKTWHIDESFTAIANDITFSPDGNKVYYSYWYTEPSLYELDWNANKIHYVQLPGDYTSDNYYARSIAVCKGGGMVYAAMKDNTGIFAMNTQDRGKQLIPTSYYPLALACSPDGETLYSIGYFLNSNNDRVYLIHKYGGLKTVGPFNTELLDYALTSKDYFYTTDGLSYINTPSNAVPSNIAITPEGKYAYVSTIGGDSVSSMYGKGIVIYDLEYMNQVKTIDEKNSLHDIAASSSKIIFSPPADYSWLKSVAGSSFHGTFTSTLLVPTSFHPENGTFAKTYKDELFVVYATFSDYLDNKTVNSSTVWLTEKSGTSVSGKVTAASKLAIFMPDSQLKANTDYVMHLSKAIKSKDGKQLYSDAEWGFTTRNTSNATIVPISTLLNITGVKKLTLTIASNLTIPIESSNNSQSNNSNITLPPQAIRTGNETNNTEQTPEENQGQAQVPGQMPSNMTNLTQQASNITNQTQPASNASQAAANASTGSGTSEQGGNDFWSGIINFFKSLFGMK